MKIKYKTLGCDCCSCDEEEDIEIQLILED
jgi:hypothetical protein